MAKFVFPELPADVKLGRIETFSTFVVDPLPEAQWLIEGLFEKDALAIIWGASGEGKTFVVLDMLVAIATGEKWLGKYPVKKGNVIYAIGESPRGLMRRAAGAARYRGLKDVPGLHFYPQAPQLLTAQGLKHFLKQIEPLKPKVIVIDTVARSMMGGDENSAQDMGLFVHACDEIRKATGACVLLVHHTAKARKPGQPPSERGSGALRGAMDTSIGVSMADGIIQLTNFKQKDDGLFKPIFVGTKVYELRPAEGDKPAMTTLVMVPVCEDLPTEMHDGAMLALAILRKHGKSITRLEWHELLNADQEARGVPLSSRASMFRWAKKLKDEGLVVEDDGVFKA